MELYRIPPWKNMPIFSKRQQMRRLSSDSDSVSSTTATLTDFWSAGTSSIDDGSSSRGSSMPWAAEAIEQNRRDWLQIDEMLYGERELPRNDRLRQELVQWMARFPHIRTRGRAIESSDLYAIQMNKTIKKDEEVFAIDPQPRKHFLMTFQPNHLDNHHQLSTNSTQNRFVTNTSHLLEKCLRITSSSWSKRPSAVTSGNVRHVPLLESESSSAVRIKSVRSEIHRPSDFGGKSAALYGRTFSSSNVQQKNPSDVHHEHETIVRPSLPRFHRRPPAVPLIDIVTSTGNWAASRSTASGHSSRLILPPITNSISNNRNRYRSNQVPSNDLLLAARSVSAIHNLPLRN